LWRHLKGLWGDHLHRLALAWFQEFIVDTQVRGGKVDCLVASRGTA